MDFLSVRFSLLLVVDVCARVCSWCGGCLSSQLFSFAFFAAALSRFFGVMRCDRFFLFLSRGFSFDWWLVASSFESLGFCFRWFFADLIKAFWGFSGYAQLSVVTVFASSVLHRVLRSLIGYQFSIRFPWLLLFLVFSKEW